MGEQGIQGERGADGSGGGGSGLTNEERAQINTNTTKITTLENTVGSNAGAGFSKL